VARLFFAVWPDEDAARALAALALRLADASGGRPVPLEKVHMTLAFLGEVPDEARTAARRAASRIRARAFTVALDHVGAFRRAGVAWAGSSVPPPALLSLQRRLDDRLRDCGFTLEERPFTPHVTLARRTRRAVARAAIEPIPWRARELTLVRTEAGTGGYAVEERWALGG
jgi:RNA 2',3'-cyclic 3'-phosphodiesterase